MGVEGNERADDVAKLAAKKAGIQRWPEMFASLGHVSRKILERRF